MHKIYQQGCSDALHSFGVAKEAVDWSGLGTGLKEFFVGKPLEYGKQLISGEAYKPNGMLRNAFTGGGPGTPTVNRVMHAASIALPTALMIPQLLRMPATQRGSAVGQFAGSLAGSLIGAPMGIVGQMGGSLLGGELGDYIGSKFNPRDHRSRAIAEAARASQPPMDKGRVLSRAMSEVTGRPVDL